MGMHITYLAITILVAAANCYAASLNFVGAESVKVVAERVRVSTEMDDSFRRPVGLGWGRTAGRLRVPALGTAAAIGLVVYFICAVTAHVRVRDPRIGGAVSFLVLVVAALIADLAYHHHW